MKNWMHCLAQHYENLPNHYPDEAIVSDFNFPLWNSRDQQETFNDGLPVSVNTDGIDSCC